jgi:uncharacterized protein (TIGR00270 family)
MVIILYVGDIKMPQCEMCGKDSNLIDAIVEGIMLSVCSGCSKFGHVIPVRKPIEIDRPRSLHVERQVYRQKEVQSIVSDYSLLIKKARERKDLKQETLARAIAEKESVIHKLESGSLEPTFDLAKKLEQYLGIKIIILSKETYEKQELDVNDGGLTIGDLMKFKKIS